MLHMPYSNTLGTESYQQLSTSVKLCPLYVKSGVPQGFQGCVCVCPSLLNGFVHDLPDEFEVKYPILADGVILLSSVSNFQDCVSIHSGRAAVVSPARVS